MYVCVCNCVTDRQLIETAVECACTLNAEEPRWFAEQVADRLGAGLGCGTCREFAVELIERAAAHQASVVLPERARSFRIDTLPSSLRGHSIQSGFLHEDDALSPRGE